MTNQVLVAVDWRSEGLDIAPVLAFVGDALVDHVITTVPDWRTGEEIPAHRVTFDRNARNTEVHGAGSRAGFVCHIEQDARPAETA